jgi:hypothetical protein
VTSANLPCPDIRHYLAGARLLDLSPVIMGHPSTTAGSMANTTRAESSPREIQNGSLIRGQGT